MKSSGYHAAQVAGCFSSFKMHDCWKADCWERMQRILKIFTLQVIIHPTLESVYSSYCTWSVLFMFLLCYVF